MISIDRIKSTKTNKLLGLEILIGDEFYFISKDQKLWEGVRLGRFPSLIEDRIIRLPVITMKVIDE